MRDKARKTERKSVCGRERERVCVRERERKKERRDAGRLNDLHGENSEV
jgi:hypothetical protein